MPAKRISTRTTHRGRAAVPIACPLELALSEDPLTEYKPDLYQQARDLVERYRFVDDLSVVASLTDASVVTVTGARERIVGLARAMLAQAAALRTPGDLRIMTYFEPEHEPDWGWLKWLPHARSGRGQERQRVATGPSLLTGRGHRLAVAPARGPRTAATGAAAPDRGVEDRRQQSGCGRRPRAAARA